MAREAEEDDTLDLMLDSSCACRLQGPKQDLDLPSRRHAGLKETQAQTHAHAHVHVHATISLIQ